MISILLSTEQFRSHLPIDLWNAVYDELASVSMHLSISKLPNEQLTADGFVPQVLTEWCVDGLLINYTDHIPQEMIRRIGEHHLPSIWLSTRQPHDGIYFDDVAAARELTEHCIKAGHRRIAFVQYGHYAHETAEAHHSVRDRPQGVTDAMTDAGLTPILFGDRSMAPKRDCRDDWVKASLALLQRPDRPTAVVTYGHEYYPLILAAGQLGLRVPHDLAISTFAETPADTCGVCLPTMINDYATMGISAVEMLLAKIRDPLTPLSTRAVSFCFVQKEAIRPLNAMCKSNNSVGFACAEPGSV